MARPVTVARSSSAQNHSKAPKKRPSSSSAKNELALKKKNDHESGPCSSSGQFEMESRRWSRKSSGTSRETIFCRKRNWPGSTACRWAPSGEFSTRTRRTWKCNRCRSPCGSRRHPGPRRTSREGSPVLENQFGEWGSFLGGGEELDFRLNFLRPCFSFAVNMDEACFVLFLEDWSGKRSRCFGVKKKLFALSTVKKKVWWNLFARFFCSEFGRTWLAIRSHGHTLSSATFPDRYSQLFLFFSSLFHTTHFERL